MLTTTEPNRRISIRQMATRSTIYNRHEARRARTLALKDDPRHPLVRVMSGLPLTNLIVPPYEPQQFVAPTKAVVDIDFTESEEDAFSRYTEEKQPKTSNRPSFLSVGIAAASGCILSELFIGKGSALASPFASNTAQVTARQVVPVFHEGGAAALASIRGTIKTPISAGISISQLVRPAASAFFLFGSKAAVEQYLIDDVTEPFVTAAAAGSAGIVQALSKTFIGQRVAFSREVASITVYFSAYEGVKHLLNRDSCEKPSMITVAVSGAIAGATSVCIRGGNVSSAATRMMPFAQASTQRLSLAALRAAPYHALLFVGYETVMSMSTQ